MPLGRFQSEVLRTLAAQRSPDSYIAGGVAINRAGPRFSGDIDIFHDSEERLESGIAGRRSGADGGRLYDRLGEGAHRQARGDGGPPGRDDAA